MSFRLSLGIFFPGQQGTGAHFDEIEKSIILT
jgi:hypothetical protein